MSKKYDRHFDIINYLIKSPRVTYAKLSYQFNVSVKTIKQDISELSYHLPIATFQGVGGGVEISKAVFINGYIMKREHIHLIVSALKTLYLTNPDNQIVYLFSLMQIN